MGHGTWDMGNGTWDMGHGTWDMRHGKWDMGRGTYCHWQFKLNAIAYRVDLKQKYINRT